MRETDAGYRSPEDVGGTIAELRRRRRLGQAEIAARLGVDQAAMSRIERGQRGISARELYVLADVFGVDPGIILRRERGPALLRAGGADEAAVRRGLDAFERLAREVLAARALRELL
jgi:transcriptional regulator with XRE-family HTH domain